MRLYIAVTGVLFALIVVAHIARMFTESQSFMTDPTYVALTLVSLGLSLWALRLLLRRAPV